MNLSVEIRVRGPEIREPVLIAAIPPGAGLAGLIAVDHMVRTLKLEEVGFAESPLFPPIVGVENGRAYHPIRMFAGPDLGLYAVKGEVPVLGRGLVELSSSLTGWIDRSRPRMILLPDGVGVENRLEIEKPIVLKAFNSERAREIADKIDAKVLERGYISGFPALMLREAERRGIPAIAFIAQAFEKYPDPSAAVSLLESMGSLLDIEIDTKPLEEKSEEVRALRRDLMETVKAAPVLPSYVG